MKGQVELMVNLLIYLLSIFVEFFLSVSLPFSKYKNKHSGRETYWKAF